MSPRIVWFSFLRLIGKIFKLACMCAVLLGIAWGAWRGIQQAFYKNPDFRLQVITLNPNPVIDELAVAEAAGIDLSANPNLFDLSAKNITRKLTDLPEIADAHVECQWPGTLAVNVIPRVPRAWISCPGGGWAEVRRAGALLVDDHKVAYPCPERQLDAASSLPIIELPPSIEHPIQPGQPIYQIELEHCLSLLEAARIADADAMQWIQSVRQINEWSILLVTRQGTSATFALGDHARQIENLCAALAHAGEKGYLIDTINLIPKYNIPITLRNETPPPRAIPVSSNSSDKTHDTRPSRNGDTLLKRN
jgi:hypothetical protein